MNIHPTFKESLKSDILLSIYVLLWGIAMMMLAYVLSTSAPILRFVSLFYVFFALYLIIMGITRLVITFPHYRQLTKLLEKAHSEEMLLTIETKICEGESYYYGNFDWVFA